MLRAASALRLARAEEAKAAAERALKLDSKSATGHQILGEILLAQGDRAAARREFRAALLNNQSNFHSRLGLARVSKDHAAAVKLYASAAKLAQNDWQRVEVLHGKALALARLNRAHECLETLRALLEISPSHNTELIFKALRNHGHGKLVESFTHPHRTLAAKARARLNPGTGERSALLNGGFEMGLSRHWGDVSSTKTVGGIWINFGKFQSFARPTTLKYSGDWALRIDNASPEGTNDFGATQQRVPIIRNATYRFSMMAKARNLGPKSFHVVINRNKFRIIRLDPGTYDWKQFTGTFKLNASEAMVRLRMRSTGTVWIDDLKIELIKLPEAPKPKK